MHLPNFLPQFMSPASPADEGWEVVNQARKDRDALLTRCNGSIADGYQLLPNRAPATDLASYLRTLFSCIEALEKRVRELEAKTNN